MTWLRKFKDAGIPVKTGRVPGLMIHHKWTIVNGEFSLGGSGNYSAVAFDGACHAEIFETHTAQAHLDVIKREFEQLWEEGRVLQWASKNSACFMYFGETLDETMYHPGEEDDEEEETRMNPPGEQDENVVDV